MFVFFVVFLPESNKFCLGRGAGRQVGVEGWRTPWRNAMRSSVLSVFFFVFFRFVLAADSTKIVALANTVIEVTTALIRS